jgi:alkylated DNA nucleotide flippase Atl1
VNASGQITNPHALIQIQRLALEGIKVNNARLSLKQHQWQPSRHLGSITQSETGQSA